MQTWDEKTGPEQIWWKTVTACNDFPADILQHQVYLQWFNWDSLTWEDKDWQVYPFGIFGGDRLNTDFYATSRYRTVDDYLGAYCWRIRVRHWVIEYTKGMWDGTSYSGGECY